MVLKQEPTTSVVELLGGRNTGSRAQPALPAIRLESSQANPRTYVDSYSRWSSENTTPKRLSRQQQACAKRQTFPDTRVNTLLGDNPEICKQTVPVASVHGTYLLSSWKTTIININNANKS